MPSKDSLIPAPHDNESSQITVDGEYNCAQPHMTNIYSVETKVGINKQNNPFQVSERYAQTSPCPNHNVTSHNTYGKQNRTKSKRLPKCIYWTHDIDLPENMGELIHQYATAVVRMRWEEFVKEHTGIGDFVSLEELLHSSQQLL